MTRTFLVVFFCVSILLLHAACNRSGPAGGTERDALTLLVMSTNDVHGWIMPWDYYTGQPAEEYGHVKAATLIDSLRNEFDNTLLLDAGDWLQGNPFAEYFARVDTLGRHFPGMMIFDLLDYDAVVIGNHEFNFGVDYLNRQIDSTDTPMIGGNIFYHGTTSPAYKPYTLHRFGEATVAVVGLTTPGSAIWDRPYVEGVLDFGDGVEAARKYVAEVREKGADVVVVLAHTGYEGDCSYDVPDVGAENFGRTVARTVPGVDLVVLGHHMQVIDTVVTGAGGQQVGVMLAGNRGSHLGCATLTLERIGGAWSITDQEIAVLPVKHAEPMPELVARFSDDHKEVREWVSQPLAHTPNHWHTSDARTRDAPVTDLINHVQMDATGAQLSSASVFKTDVSFGPGSVTLAHISQLYHYENTLYLLEVTGEIVREYLEYTSQYYLPMRRGEELAVNPDWYWEGYNFDMLAGVHYVLDLTRPFGQRVTSLTYKGEAVADDDVFTMAVNSYRAQGGGGFTMLEKAKVLDVVYTPVRDLIADYLRASGVITHEDVFEKNWELIGP